jgi:hypothetical protein
MKNPRLLAGLLASVLFSATGIQPASAQLPSLNDPPWLGYNSVFANKRYQFTITAQGKIMLTPMNEKGDPVAHTLAIPVEIIIQEMMPDGKPVWKQINAQSLASAQPATDKLEKVVLTGKVTGDAAFEATIEQSRGAISIGGRITNPGTLTKNPIRFGIRVKFPNAYPKVEVEEKKEDAKEKTKEEIREEKRAERKAKREADSKKDGKKDDKKGDADAAALKKIEEDRIDMKWTDGTRKKLSLIDEVDATSKEINGPGIAGAEIEVSAYQGRKLLLIASTNSSMTLANEKTGPLFQGFSLNWLPDAAKDKEGKARLTIEAK